METFINNLLKDLNPKYHAYILGDQELQEHLYTNKFDAEETAILIEGELGHRKAIGNVEEVKTLLSQAAKNYREQANKKRQITIRLSEHDIAKIKMIANKEGLPYQTYISSVLHKLSL